MRNGIRRGILVFFTLFGSTNVHARVYDLYRADYPKGAFCSAIGGACASDVDPEDAFFQNPAALTAGEPDFSFDGDYTPSGNLEPGMKQNNDVSESQYMAGLGWSGEDFGIGGSITGRRDQVNSNVSVIDEQGLTQKFPLSSDALQLMVNIPLSFRISRSLSFGVALNGFSYSQTMSSSGGQRASSASPDAMFRLGFTVGMVGKMGKKFRIGSWFKSPITAYSSLDFQSDAYGNTLNYHEDMALRMPWIWAGGISYMPWGDERTILFDADVVGDTPGGYLLGYDTFATATGNSSIVQKGTHVVIEPRLGMRMPWSHGSPTTVLLGTYYETSRYQAIAGREHFTAGVAYKATNWIELMLGGDFSRDFSQVFFTFR